MPPSLYKRLKLLRDKTEATSFAEVVKNALRLYEALIQEAEAGNKVYIKQLDGDEITYRIVL